MLKLAQHHLICGGFASRDQNVLNQKRGELTSKGDIEEHAVFLVSNHHYRVTGAHGSLQRVSRPRQAGGSHVVG